MRGSTFAAAAAALFASSAVARHQAVVHNLCANDVYLWAVDASNCVDGAVARNPMGAHKIAPGSLYREVMRELISGGVSLKLSQEDDLYGAITQFEYTWDGTTWYDLSNVNCDAEDCPFAAEGMYMDSGPGCPTVLCPAGNATCHMAYNNFDDDWASLCCPEGEPDVQVYLCADGPNSPTGGAPSEPAQPSEYSTPDVDAVAAEAKVADTPKPTHHRPKPTPVDPATEVVEVTQVKTVVVTVTPGADKDRRHIHQHNHAHAHHH